MALEVLEVAGEAEQHADRRSVDDREQPEVGARHRAAPARLAGAASSRQPPKIASRSSARREVVLVAHRRHVQDQERRRARLDLSLERGLITGLIGPNGAGKKTVFNVLTGALKSLDHGTVVLGGRDITGLPPHLIARAGMVRSFQNVRILARLTVLENVMTGVAGQRGEQMRVVLSPMRIGRADRRHRSEPGMAGVRRTRAARRRAGRSLAFGEQKLVALARVLATDAEVLLLDEPASARSTGAGATT